MNAVEETILNLHDIYDVRHAETDIVLLSSFSSYECMILLDLCNKARRFFTNLEVVFLDTGRLPQETYDCLDNAMMKYNMTVHTLYPDQDILSQYMRDKGPNPFYESVDDRKMCCGIRKVAPLQDWLSTYKPHRLLTGLRNTKDRSDVKLTEYQHHSEWTMKFNPIYNWTKEDVLQYVKDHNIRANRLLSEGYDSIGCAPCTAPGVGRSGRWSWEADGETKECGLHTDGSGI